MKKITLTILFGLFLTLSFAQTIVSTTPANKNGLLEEFTGIHCGYCPQGHAIANSIKADNPDTFYIINVHTGGYAAPGNGEPDFRTEFGDDIASQSQLAGYPAGTISRHYFGHSQYQAPAGATALDRGQWESDFNSLKTQPSYVNVAVEADVDNRSRMLTVHVEAYYTGDSPVNTNMLNVALLQNNTSGPQTGGNAGNNYNHMHRLINMVTGQWGEEILTTSEGTFVDKTFTFYVTFDNNGVPINLDELEVVAFIAETHQEVITASGALVNKLDTALNQNDVILSKTKIKEPCNGELSPIIKVENIGINPVTSLDIEYSINGESVQNFTWSGNMASFTTKLITIPATTFNLLENNTFSIEITTPDNDMSNNDYAGDNDFKKAPETTEDIAVQIVTDNWGYELTWNIKNSSGAIVASGGGNGEQGSAGSYGNNSNTTENYTLPMDCYTLEVNDSYGDGGNAVGIRDANGDLITSIQGRFYGFGDYTFFSTSDTASVLSSEFANVVIYPNPSNGMVTITEAKGDSISIFNVLGKQVYNATILTNNNSINLSNLASGVYLVKLVDGNKEESRKLIIK